MVTENKTLTLNVNEQYAKAARLVYVSNTDPGISRQKKGKGFVYFFENRQVTDPEELLRIKRLVIPPAWREVWICRHHNGHIQATGLDVKNRKQYKYHELWNKLRNETKFYRLKDFGEALPQLRLKIEKDISQHELNEDKVIGTVISLMERTSIRIGNSAYEKLYGSHGLTTLKDKHVKINGDSILFSFKGKKGVSHNISIKSRKLARIVKQCRDIPGKELFQYTDASGTRHVIDSGKVNAYINQVTGKDFTAKDFRTWTGTLNALHAFRETGAAETKTEINKNIVTVLDYVSRQLGNTRTVCRKYYVHPLLINLYETKCLSSYLDELDEIEKDDDKTGLTCEERLLMKILSSAENSAKAP